MTIPLALLAGFMIGCAVYGLVKRRLIGSLIMAFWALLSLGLVQGDEGPYAILGGPFVTLICALLLLLLSLSSRQLYPVVARRPRSLIACYSLFFVLAVFGGLLNIELLDQWRLIFMYSILLILPLVLPWHLRLLPLYGLIAASFLQLLSTLVARDYITTLSGVSQLSGGVQPNVLALQAVSIALFGASILGRPVGTWQYRCMGLSVFLFGSYGVISTVSRSGATALIAGFAVVIAMSFSRMWITFGTFFLACVLLAVAGGAVRVAFVSDWFVRGDSESLSSLTGRTDIWAHALSMAAEKPMLGWGFGALYRLDFSGGSFLRAVEGTNAHNAWLQLLVEVGFIGVLIMVVTFILVTKQALRVESKYERILLLALLVVILANSTVSAGFATLGFAELLFAAIVSGATWQFHPPGKRYFRLDKPLSVPINV